MTVIRIATRQSMMALAQARRVKQALLQLQPTLTIKICGFTTTGDRQLHMPLKEIGGKGLFVKALEKAILTDKADMAVHSTKDMPVRLPPGLMMIPIFQRDDVRDAFISCRYQGVARLPFGAVIGTASPRRQAQLQYLRPDVRIKCLRGNVTTRLQQLDNGHYDAIVLAVAGLKRLNLMHRATDIFSVDDMLPAVGQGSLCLELKIADRKLRQLVSPLQEANTVACVNAERGVASYLKASCHTPLAVYANVYDHHMKLKAWVTSLDGRRRVSTEVAAALGQSTTLADKAAKRLLNDGAQAILDHC